MQWLIAKENGSMILFLSKVLLLISTLICLEINWQIDVLLILISSSCPVLENHHRDMLECTYTCEDVKKAIFKNP